MSNQLIEGRLWPKEWDERLARLFEEWDGRLARLSVQPVDGRDAHPTLSAANFLFDE